jgi:hypothetical protein
MPQSNLTKQSVRILALALLLLLLGASGGSRAASLESEICDVDPDRDSKIILQRIALHRRFLSTHQSDALAHYHLGFAYGTTGRKSDEITEYVSAARLGLEKWDLFLNLGLA